MISIAKIYFITLYFNDMLDIIKLFDKIYLQVISIYSILKEKLLIIFWRQ